MDILVIGNGFDLAHGLPTKYSDFLQFIKDKEFIQIQKESIVQEFKNLSDSNVWLEYFSDKIDENKRWIDFELEISVVVKSIEYMRKYLIYKKEVEQQHRTSIPIIDIKVNMNLASNIFYELRNKIKFNLEQIVHSDEAYQIQIIDRLSEDLNKLIRCLELYLSWYVEKIDIKLRIPEMQELQIKKVLSFNYTDTYKKYYGQGNTMIEYDFIHGRAKEISSIVDNNMVLGIDEYLNDDEKDKNIKFIEFKKYFQRIYKETGCRYKSWIPKFIKNSGTTMSSIKGENHIYIYGHSLDITDKDVLNELITQDNTITTIYYHNKDAYKERITNLVKVIGQDELIKRVSGPNKTIIFKQQQDMIEV